MDILITIEIPLIDCNVEKEIFDERPFRTLKVSILNHFSYYI